MNITIKSNGNNTFDIIDNENEANNFYSYNWDMLYVLAYVYFKYGDSAEKAFLIKEFILKDKAAKFTFDNKEL
jgi:hypothetical protein